MPDLGSNIKFNYEYRDAGGYRKAGSIVFTNSSGIKNYKTVESQIRKYLFDSEFFYPYKLSVPSIHFDKWSHKLDHDWYRFESLDFTNEQETDPRTFNDFLSDLRKLAKQPLI